MRRRLSREAGFTLVEVLVAATLMIIVLSATLTTLDSAGQTRVRNDQQNDSQDLARQTLDTISAQIRNLASPTASTIRTIDTATSYDLIFQTNDPNKRWVRYCLATDNATHNGVQSTPENGTLWYQTPSAAFVSAGIAPTPAMKTTCPVDPVVNPAVDQGWATAKAVARHVVNRINSQDRPVFFYNSTGDTVQITNIVAGLFVDYDPNRKPGEVRIATGDYLRNQNEAPTAAMFKPPTGAARNWQFNGTASSDPEGRRLLYLWYKTSAATPDTSTMPTCSNASSMTNAGWTCIGEGSVINYTFPSTDVSPQKVYLKVTDPGLLNGFDSYTLALS